MSKSSNAKSLSKTLLKVMLPAASMLILGWNTGMAADAPCAGATLEAKDKVASCVGGNVYGDFHATTPEDDDLDHSKQWMDFAAYLYFRAALPTVNGWSTEANVEARFLEGTVYAREAWVGVNRGMFGIFAGKHRVGDVDLGNYYTSELGHTFEGYYGDLDLSRNNTQPQFGLNVMPVEGLTLTAAYSARRGDVSFEGTEDAGNQGVTNLVAKFSRGPLGLNAKYENHAYQDNDQNVSATGADNHVKRSESAMGVAAKYTIMDKFTPFINYGSYTVNDPNDRKDDLNKNEVNYGVDLALHESFGLTIAGENFSDNGKVGTEDTKDYHNGYISGSYSIGAATLYAGYWFSDQKVEDGNGNLKNQFDLELMTSF